jgi:hypothetical protein
MAMGCYVLSHHWHGADELVPAENLFLTDRQLQEKLLRYFALPEADKKQAVAALRSRACERFDLATKIPQINRLIGAAATAWAQEPAAVNGR